MNKYLSLILCLLLIPTSITSLGDEDSDDGVRVYNTLPLPQSMSRFLKKHCSVQKGIQYGIMVALAAILSTAFGFIFSSCNTMHNVCLDMQDACTSANASMHNASALLDNLQPQFENAQHGLMLLETIRRMSLDLIKECPQVAQRYAAQLAALAINPQ